MPFLPLEYEEACGDRLALPQASSPMIVEPSPAVVAGVPEEEVERRIQVARDVALEEADEQMRLACERVAKSAQEKIVEVLNKFAEERLDYFKRVEGEIVQLSLAVARKILQREAAVDPTLLVALVRVALDRMQCGSAVRIRVAAENSDTWLQFRDANGGPLQWEIVSDETLSFGDCIVETEVGTANFGFEAQLRDVEVSFAQLLAHRPHLEPSHAATV